MKTDNDSNQITRLLLRGYKSVAEAAKNMVARLLNSFTVFLAFSQPAPTPLAPRPPASHAHCRSCSVSSSVIW